MDLQIIETEFVGKEGREGGRKSEGSEHAYVGLDWVRGASQLATCLSACQQQVAQTSDD